MSSYQAPNARELSELDYLELKQQLQLLERQIKTASVEDNELRSVTKGRTAYELKSKILFQVDPADFSKRKREELQDLRSEQTQLAAKIKTQESKLGLGR